MKLLCPTLLLLALSASLPAQLPPITPDTPAGTEMLHQWLHSGDPRLIAWAADFARRTHDTKLIGDMPSFLERSPMPPNYSGDGSQILLRRALLGVLDTLIQEKAVVPISSIQAIEDAFPTHALILIARLPIAESRPTLTRWTYESTGSSSAATVARVASMLLAKDDPEPNFVAQVVAASEEELHVHIVATGGGVEGGSMGGGCGDGGHNRYPGWPTVHNYHLAENDPDASASLVIDLDHDRITAQRFDENNGPPSCSSVPPLNPVTRHRLIAHWLGLQDADMSWHALENESIIWTNNADYERKLGTLIESHRQQLRATVETLHQRSLLTNDLAATTAPRLIVTIQCSIKPCPLP